MSLSKRYLFYLLLLYFLLRGFLLLFPLEDITLETCRGMIAHDLIHGLKLPFWDYTADPYALGSLLAAIWTVPFFLVFGETWFAFKLAPFVWHLFSLIFWYKIWNVYFSPRQSFFISLFFVLPPPLIVEYSLSNTGYHFQGILWAALSILLFKKILDGKVSLRIGAFFLGLLGGFSCAMMPSNGVTAGVLLLYLLWYRGGFFQKRRFVFFYSLGFLPGFSPWLLFNWSYGWPGLRFITSFFLGQDWAGSFLKNIPQLFIRALPELFGFRKLPGEVDLILGIILTGAYLFSLLYLGWQEYQKNHEFRQKFNIKSFGLFYQICLLILSVSAVQGTHGQYLYPMVPFIGMTFVTALESFGPKWKTIIATFYLGLSLIGYFSLCQWDQMGRSLILPGYNKYVSFNTTLEFNFGHDWDLFWGKTRELLKQEDATFKKDFYESLSKDLFQIKGENDLEKVVGFIQKEETAYQSILYDRLGTGLGLFLQFDPQILKKTFENYAIPQEMQYHVYPGFIQALNWSSYSKEERLSKADQICESTPAGERIFCEEGKRRLDP